MAGLIRLGRKVGGLLINTLLPIAIIIGAVSTILFVLSELLNTEMTQRNAQELSLTSTAYGGGGLLVRLILHRFLPDENAVEASVALEWRYDNLSSAYKNQEKCVTALIGDGTRPGVPFIRTVALDCTQVAVSTNGSAFISEGLYAESARFQLNTYGSANAFPFDEIYIHPWMTTLMNPRSDDAPNIVASYELDRQLVGLAAYVRSKEPNIEIGLQRTTVEKTFVLGSTFVFVLLTLIVTIKLCSKDTKLTGLQEVLAVAGYLVAIDSFRNLTGMSHTNGRSALEVVVFGFALGAPAIGIALSAWRSRQANTDH
jgi:hypothetical protein